MDYRNLSIEEKIAQVQEYRSCGEGKKHQAAYLNALQSGDESQIAEYETFGDSPRKIIMNLNSYGQAQAFGFTGREFNEYGWLANAHFTSVEQIEFFHRKGWAAHNYITIGCGANGKWSYGASYSTGGAGGGYGLGIWGKVFDSRKECLAAALRGLSDRHAEQRKRRLQFQFDYLQYDCKAGSSYAYRTDRSQAINSIIQLKNNRYEQSRIYQKNRFNSDNRRIPDS